MASNTFTFSSRSDFAVSDVGGSMATKPMHLEQVGDDHVPEGAGALVEPGSALDGQRLGNVDLHVADVVAVPDGLEEPVGEAEGEDVVDRLLAEEVVDAEHLGLVEGGVHGPVERPSRLQVGPERLLDDDVGVLAQAGGAEHPDHGAEGHGRYGQVEQAPRVPADGLLGRGHLGQQRLGSSGSAAPKDSIRSKVSMWHPSAWSRRTARMASRAWRRNCASVIANWAGAEPMMR